VSYVQASSTPAATGRSAPPTKPRPDLERIGFLLILAAFVGLALVYNVVTPAGEGVDEVAHFQYTLYLKQHHRLPVMLGNAAADTVIMGFHPPLYYAVSALVIAPLPTDDLATALPPNPHFIWIEGTGPGNRNVFLHSPVTGGDPFPYQGVVLAIHVLRFSSTLLGIIALLAVRALLRFFFQPNAILILAATAASAFQPTFLTTFSTAKNDAAVSVFILLGILWSVHYVRAAYYNDRRPSPVVAGLILGIALLTKETTLVLVPVYAVAVALGAWQRRQWRPELTAAGTVGVIAALTGGWWYVRNFAMYGDFLAQPVHDALNPAILRTGPYTWGDLVAFFQQLGRNYWGGFGYEHILLDPRIFYTLWLLLAIAVPFFLAYLIGRRHEPVQLAGWAVALTAIGAHLVLFVKWSTIVGGGAAHGRYFAAVIPFVAAIMVGGFSVLPPRRVPVASLVFASGLVVLGALSPWLAIAPAYRPPVATAAELATATPLRTTFGDELTLMALSQNPLKVAPGGTSTIELFWQRSRPIPDDLRFRLRAVARDGTTFFDKEYWPAGGSVPTFTWPDGVTYRDAIQIPVPDNVEPGVARVLVSARGSDGRWLDANQASEVEVAHLLVADASVVTTAPADARPVGVLFNDGMNLVAERGAESLAPDGTFDVTLYWQTNQQLVDDVTVSVQVLNPAGQLVAQNDAEPASGRAPTSTWDVGQLVADPHRVVLPKKLPAGDYQVTVLLYTRPNLARLHLANRPAEDRLSLANLRVP
jgi:hypothetical protein